MPSLLQFPTLIAEAMLKMKNFECPAGGCQGFPDNQIPFQGVSDPTRQWFVWGILADGLEALEASGSCSNLIEQELIHSI